MDEIKDGERISCNGVNGTVIGKRSTRNRRLVVVQMDNGFTLKLNTKTLSARSPETSRTSATRCPQGNLSTLNDDASL